MFYHFLGWFGISDHKGGVLLLMLTNLLRMGFDSQFRHVAVEIGGPKRLHALVTAFSVPLFSLLMLPTLVFTHVSALCHRHV